MGKILLNGVDYSAPSKSGVAGVKGDMESSYHTGYVSLTADDIGALNADGTAANAHRLQNLQLGRWNGIPQIKNDGIMEIGKSIDFHTSANDTSDYTARISAESSGLSLTGTTKGTFVSENAYNETADEYEIHRTTVDENSVDVYAYVKSISESEDNMGDVYYTENIIETNATLTDSGLTLQSVLDEYETKKTIYKNGQIEYSNNFSIKNLNFSEYELFPMTLASAKMDLGTSNYKWRNIYAINGTIQTSDRTKKANISTLTDNKSKAFIMGLTPVSYKMTEGTSGRTHYGLIAQDVEDLMVKLGMDSKDFAGFIKSPAISVKNADHNETSGKTQTEGIEETQYHYALRYDEFLAPLIKTVQSQQNEIEELKTELSELKALLHKTSI